MSLLETVFIETETPEPDNEDEDQAPAETDPLRIELIKNLRQSY